MLYRFAWLSNLVLPADDLVVKCTYYDICMNRPYQLSLIVEYAFWVCNKIQMNLYLKLLLIHQRLRGGDYSNTFLLKNKPSYSDGRGPKFTNYLIKLYLFMYHVIAQSKELQKYSLKIAGGVSLQYIKNVLPMCVVVF